MKHFDTTLCWRCPTVYPMNDRDCPNCHATNANVDFEKALSEGAADIRSDLPSLMENESV